MPDRPGPRFVIRGPDGVDTPIESVEGLQDHVEAGKVHPESSLYDASTGQWSPVGAVPVFRFIIEELAEAGTLPEDLSILLAEGTEEQEGVGTPDKDPFDLTLDLVDTDPLEAAAADDVEVEETVDTTSNDEDDMSSEEGLGLELGRGMPLPEREPEAEEVAEDAPAEADDEDWFRPAEEGGIALPDPREKILDDDEPAEIWKPDPEAAPEEPAPVRRSSHPNPRPLVAGGVILLGLLVGAGILMWNGGDLSEFEAIPGPSPLVEAEPPPPLPAGLGQEGELILDRIDLVFQGAVESLRGEMGLEASPPGEWLSGGYLAAASGFPEVLDFWEGYGEFLDRLRSQDRSLYLRAVDEGAEELDVTQADRQRLVDYFRQRLQEREDFRQSRYDHLQATARAAIRLHQVLLRHEDVIGYSPAVGGGVSADPILEADIPAGTPRSDVDRALDQIFIGLDRSRGGGAPSQDGLRTELFGSFGDR